jgi:hypothetical protein
MLSLINDNDDVPSSHGAETRSGAKGGKSVQL